VATGLVALVGRPNVGKSTLFNRLVRRQLAVIEDTPGTTRDRNYAEVEWAGRQFTIVDTGGIEAVPEGEIARAVREQALVAMQEANAIAFCIDVETGATAEDHEVANLLRRSGKPIVVVATKSDNAARREASADAYRLGFEDVLPVSALHGTGTGDLLDWCAEHAGSTEESSTADRPRIAIVGRPNVGKSSLLNALVGAERSIVSAEPGTTRDAIDTVHLHRDREIVLIDTAGIRRRGRIEVGVEKYSVLRAIRAVDRADVVLLVVDASEGVTNQDTHLGGYVCDAGRACVIVANKWDLHRAGSESSGEFDAALAEAFKFMAWAPFVHVSALTHSRVGRALDLALAAWDERRRRIPTAELNRVVQAAVEAHAPPSQRGHRLKILFCTQAEIEPPTFVLFTNRADLVPEGYERYLENRLRAAFGFSGTPVRLRFRNRVADQREEA